MVNHIVILSRKRFLLQNVLKGVISGLRPVSYCQGQYFGKQREYFYFIDHQGQLFLDDSPQKNFTSCFKDPRFLTFFFSRIKLNSIGRYESEFPYLSPCGLEMNFIRCDDRPIVFTSLDENKNSWYICFSKKEVSFEPHRLCMFKNGRLYHPCGLADYGLVRSKLALELFPNLVFGRDEVPSHISWKGESVKLTNELLVYDI